MRSHILRLAALFASVATSALLGQDITQPSETLPGFQANQVFQSSPFDDVNLFSGVLSVRVPLGPKYQLSRDFDWQLAAYYSSRPWRLVSHECAGSPISSHAGGTSALGLGWTLELGSVEKKRSVDGLYYHTPDGGMMQFSRQADGSFRSPAAKDTRIEQSDQVYTVFQPDGSKYTYDAHLALRSYLTDPVFGPEYAEYDRYPTDGAPNEHDPGFERYGLTKIEDRYGHEVLTVEYSIWKPISITLKDTLGGDRVITLTWNTIDGFDVLTGASFPVTTTPPPPPPAPQIPTINYLTINFQRSLYGFTRMGETPSCDSSPPRGTVNLHKLTKIFASGRSDLTYEFGYDVYGEMTDFTLPTGGKITYVYGGDGKSTGLLPCLRDPQDLSACNPHDHPLARGQAPDPDYVPDERVRAYSKFLDNTPRLQKRTEQDPFTTYSSERTYYRDQFAEQLAEEIDPCWSLPPGQRRHCPDPDKLIRRVVVTQPNGNGGNYFTAHLFRVNVDGSANGADQISGLELERITYETDTINEANPARSLVFCYEDFRGDRNAQSPFDGACGSKGADGRFWSVDGTFTNWLTGVGSPFRLQKEMTWYGKRPEAATQCGDSTEVPCVERASASYDYNTTALEYNQSTVRSNFGTVDNGDWKQRTTVTTWQPDASHWLLKLQGSMVVTDDFYSGACGAGFPTPCSVTTTYGYTDSARPAFLTSRAVSITNSSNGTLTSTYTADTYGNPHHEVVATSGTQDYDGSTYTDTREFRFGATRSRQRTPYSWFVYNVTRSGAANLPTTSTAPNSLQTNYSYDVLGRLTDITPPLGEAVTTIRYIPYAPAQAGPPSVAPVPGYVIVKKNAGGTPEATQVGVPGAGSGSIEAYQYDGFGRVIRAIRQLPQQPNDSYSYFTVQESVYDATGQLSRRSEWTGCGADGDSNTDLSKCFGTHGGAFTSWTARDVLGRHQTLTLPDGKQVTRSFSDTLLGATVSFSDTKETVTRRVWNGTQELTQDTVTRRDALGRAISVLEPGGDETTYKYNVLDQVTKVTQGVQTRSFEYNAVGLLRFETHPENGTTQYTYTAQGKVKTKKASDNTTQTFTFDSLGRPLTASVGTTTYVSNAYDTSGGTYPVGKLTQRVGYNTALSPATSITEAFEYSDPTGRLSRKTTTFSGGCASTVSEKWDYTTLGLPGRYEHPRNAGSTVTTRQRTNNVATLTTSTAHCRTEGRILVAGISDPSFNGEYTITGRTSTTVSYDNPGPNVSATAGAGTIKATTDRPFVEAIRYVSGFPVEVTANGIPMVTATYGEGGVLGKYTTGSLADQDPGPVISTITTTITPSSSQARPARIESSQHFSTGDYSYDGSGNIKAIGSDRFSYDGRSRLVSSNVFWGDPPNVQEQALTYAYDRYGNLTDLGGILLSVHLNSATNRLDKAAAPQWYYDSRGNQLDTADGVSTFDSFDRLVSAPNNWKYYYNGAHERVAKLDSQGAWQYSFRNPDDLVATEYAGSTPWRDNVFLGKQLVASFRNNEVTPLSSSGDGATTAAPWMFYAVDHLGSVRLVTDPTGRAIEKRKYAPFGALLTPAGPVNQRVAFASMEQDPLWWSRYYDHARTHEFQLGRFLSPDKVGGRPEEPQSWNRFSYALNNPLTYVDKDGRWAQIAVGAGIGALIQGGKQIYDNYRGSSDHSFRALTKGVGRAAGRGAVVGALGVAVPGALGGGLLGNVVGGAAVSAGGAFVQAKQEGASTPEATRQAENAGVVGAIGGVAASVIDAAAGGLPAAEEALTKAAGKAAASSTASAMGKILDMFDTINNQKQESGSTPAPSSAAPPQSPCQTQSEPCGDSEQGSK